MINKNQSLSSIVTEFYQTAGIFEKYNLDYCCNGKKTLEAACGEKALPLENIMDELKPCIKEEDKEALKFSEMNASRLISHILLKHHFYVKQSAPTIVKHLSKVAEKHGQKFPFMIDVLSIFTRLQDELAHHIRKEEFILFPRIKELEALSHGSAEARITAGYIAGPVAVMEGEHEIAGGMMTVIRELTNNYAIPPGACTTFALAMSELKEFEKDLHQHVHLENNILFPMAKKIMDHILLNSIS